MAINSKGAGLCCVFGSGLGFPRPLFSFLAASVLGVLMLWRDFCNGFVISPKTILKTLEASSDFRSHTATHIILVNWKWSFENLLF